MNDALKRAIRTFVQGSVGVAALLLVPFLQSLINAAAGNGEVDVDANALQKILIAVVAGGAIALIAWVQNLVEDWKGKALLK